MLKVICRKIVSEKMKTRKGYQIDGVQLYLSIPKMVYQVRQLLQYKVRHNEERNGTEVI